MSVKIYSTPGCPYCNATKEFLRKNKIKFKDIDVSKDSKVAEEVVKLSGQSGVPVTFSGKKFVVGFNQEKLKELLKIK